MNEYALKHTDQEDILDVIELAERSFGADLSPVLNKQVNTLGEFMNLMNQHTPGESATDCTTQQAFYRIRSSLAIVLGVNPNTIRPDTKLSDLMPLASRLQLAERLRHALGIPVELLVPRRWHLILLATLAFISFVSLVPAWPYSIIGLCAYGLGVWFVHRTAVTFSVATVGQLAQKVSREHYRAVRRNALTVNRKELESLLFDLFSNELSIPRHRLTRDTLILH